jgi:hypothetical protein
MYGLIHPEFAEICVVPEQLEYVKYVPVDIGIHYNFKGNFNEYKKRQNIVYTELAKRANMNITWFKVIASLYATSATFMSYHPDFQASKKAIKEAKNNGTLDQFIKEQAKKAAAAAKKYIKTQFATEVATITRPNLVSRIKEFKRFPDFVHQWVSNIGDEYYALILMYICAHPDVQGFISQSNEASKARVRELNVPDSVDSDYVVMTTSANLASLKIEYLAIRQSLLIQFNALLASDRPFIPRNTPPQLSSTLMVRLDDLVENFYELLVNKHILAKK